MRSRSKSEIALAAGMSSATLYRWMSRHREKLCALGVRPTQRLLPPKAVEWVCYELGLHQEDFRPPIPL